MACDLDLDGAEEEKPEADGSFGADEEPDELALKVPAIASKGEGGDALRREGDGIQLEGSNRGDFENHHARAEQLRAPCDRANGRKRVQVLCCSVEMQKVRAIVTVCELVWSVLVKALVRC